ncbi:MAG: DsbA family oxidoreductase [bacterium]
MQIENQVKQMQSVGAPPSLRVDIIADFTCPWCYIAKANLDKAMAQLHSPIDIHWKPFLMFPEIPGNGVSFNEFVSQHFAQPQPVHDVLEHITQMGNDASIKLDFDQIQKVPNTIDAHRMISGADSKHLQHRMADNFFQAFFEKGSDLSNRGVLLDLAVQSGMPLKEAKNILNDHNTHKIAVAEMAEARRHGVDELPVIVFNYRWMVAGLQDTETYIKAIDAALFSEREDQNKENRVH